MGRKSAIYEANMLTEKKKTFLYLLTAKIDFRAQKNVVVTADNKDQADEYIKETYPLYTGKVLISVKGGVII